MNKRLEEVLMMNLKRSKMSLLLSILVMLVLTSCTRQQPITIGFVASLTGSTSELGVNGRNGLMIAVEEINAAGGINGRSVEVVVKDDKMIRPPAWPLTRSYTKMVFHLLSVI